MENKDGVVYLKNGKLNITDPEGLGRYPRIKTGENVRIYINGKKEGKELVVNQDLADKIEFKFESITANKELKIEISDDKLKAYLIISLTPRQQLILKDTEASNHIVVETESKAKVYPDLDKKEIIDLLDYHDIKFGIKHDYINQIVAASDDLSGEYLVAEGKAPKTGQDAEVIKSEKYKQQDQQDENFFKQIDSIDKGELICFKRELIPGKAGTNVFAEEISPPLVKDIELIAGKNVQIINNGLKAIALEGGQPQLIKRNSKVEVYVHKQYIISSDVDKYTGHIKYDGDLLVKGNVQDYFNVSVGSKLKVGGNIANAEIKTNGDLFVKNNIIASKLYIGNYLEKKVIANMKKIISDIENLKIAVEEIIGEASKREMDVSSFRTGKVIRLLVENKFKSLKNLIINTNKEIDKADKIKEKFEEVTPYFTNIANLERIKDERFLYEFKENLKEILTSQIESKGLLNIFAGYIQNSEIKIGGSVIISRSGCYNSTIKAKGSIFARNKLGFVKGGEYQAEEIIYTQSAGSQLGRTNFILGKQIFIKEALGTLVIKSEKDRIVIDPGQKNINYKVDKFGKLVQSDKLPNINKYLVGDNEI